MAIIRNNQKREWVFCRSHGRCAYCGDNLELEHFQVDHMIPQSRGGTDDWENLIASCLRCNARKRERTVDEFRYAVKGRAMRRLWQTGVITDWSEYVTNPEIIDAFLEKVAEARDVLREIEAEFYMDRHGWE